MNSIPKHLRIPLIAAAGLIVLLAIAALCVLIFVDINDYKPRLETSLSEASGMSVKIEGPISIAFTPLPAVSLSKVRVLNQGIELAFVTKSDIALELLPLFVGKIRVGTISTNGTRVSIMRDRAGHYNYQRPAGMSQTRRALNLPKVNFSDLVVAYSDQRTNDGFAAGGCNGELTEISHPGGFPLLQRISLHGAFACAELRGETPAITDLKFSVVATGGVFEFAPVTMNAFGGTGTATMHMDRAGDNPSYKVDVKLSKFRIEQFFKSRLTGKSVSGPMDFSATLTASGRTRAEMRQITAGMMSLSGSNLILNGMDLDAQLAKFESSQNLNLIDVSALLFAGPVGLVVTKGIDFTGLGSKSQANTTLRTVVSNWRVEKGLASATDVALATTKNRLAVQGGLDFVDDQYRNLTVALVDEHGCAVARQKISGSFSKPTADRSEILMPIGPFLNLLRKAGRLLAGPDSTCELFYAGTVAPPA